MALGGLERSMFTDEEKHFFDQEQALHEKKYLAGTNPRQ